MGSTTPLEALFLGVMLALLWMLVGAGLVALWRRDLSDETFTAFFNMVAWPAGVVAQWIVGPVILRRRERARQQRIADRVARGDYTAQYAREMLRWKG